MSPSISSTRKIKAIHHSLPPWTPTLILAHLFFTALLTAAVLAACGFSDGENGVVETFAFYGVYHSDPVNQLIHFVFVPCILCSMMVIMAHAPLLPLSVSFMPVIPKHVFSWATMALAFYVVFYLIIDMVGAIFYIPVLYAMYGAAVVWHQMDQKQAAAANTKSLSSWTGTGRLLQRAWLWHLLGWYMQIHPGHRVFEGSQPAVMQSFGGAITSAPFFAFYEGLWALGMRQDLQQTVLHRVDELRRDLCAQGVQMRKCPATLTESDVTSANVEL